jgi:glutamate-1-semialdehyde 2,1-aminomutase
VAAFGKVLAGGFPLAAVAGRASIMRHFDAALEGTPDYVWQAGTLNGNPVAAVAGLATLAELRKPGSYERLFRTGTRLKEGLAAAARRHGLAAQVSGEAPVFDIIFTDRPVVDYRTTLTADRARIAAFNRECLRRGVVKAVNKIYVSLAHTDADVDATLEVFDQALAVVAATTASSA